MYPKLAEGTLGSIGTTGARSRRSLIPPYRAAICNRPASTSARALRPRHRGRQPPEFGRPYVTRVPLPDADGNDLGGIRLPELAVPLGTYTGWNLRALEIGARTSSPAGPARSCRSRRPRRAPGCGRSPSSLEGRYASRADYRRSIQEAARALVDQGFLLADDVPEISARAAAFYDRVLPHPADDPSCAYTVED